MNIIEEVVSVEIEEEEASTIINEISENINILNVEDLISITEEIVSIGIKEEDENYIIIAEEVPTVITVGGEPGPAGYTPIKGIDYFDGYTPIKGIDYFDGQDGYTPIKGIDYFDGYTPIKEIDYFDGQDGYTPIKGIDYFDGDQGPAGPGIAPGGAIGQIIAKKSSTDFDTEWIDDKRGDVIGPVSTLNNSIAVYDGITGKLIKDSGILFSKQLNNIDVGIVFPKGVQPTNLTTSDNGSLIVNGNFNVAMLGRNPSEVASSIIINGSSGRTQAKGSIFLGFNAGTACFSTDDIGIGFYALGNHHNIPTIANKENVAIGYYAGSDIGNTSTRNVFIGSWSGNYTLQQLNRAGRIGSNNTCIGFRTSVAQNVLSSAAIGTGAYATKSNQMVLGDINIVETLLRGEVILDSDKSIRGKYKSEDGSIGLTATKNFTTTEGSHTVIIKDGIIISWDII